ncbi:MAG: hypothetical protein Q9168_007331 [Polycauliona sp. 1 TL-2023]
MGQRHQLFVIARINGRYRQLCAIHHQDLEGHGALQRCRDTLNIFQNTVNRLPIQQELIAASKKDDDFWILHGDVWGTSKNSHVPFPFIMTCLIIGASFNLDGYYHDVLIEPFFMAFDGGDNNNGVTIFDISEPDNTRYCFVDYLGMESEFEVELYTPLSARTYLEAYYELDATDDEAGLLPLLLPLVESFHGRSLITKGALAETWPRRRWGRIDLDTLLDRENSSVSDRPKSLRDQAMGRFLDVLLESSEQDVRDLMAQAAHLQDFLPSLRQRLHCQASFLEPSASNISLLHTALEGINTVDLSPFTSWSAEHLSTLVARLSNGHHGMQVLNLSNRPNLTESELELILDVGHDHATPSVTTVIILETPEISLKFLTKFLGNHNVYHSELFRHGILNNPDFDYKGKSQLPVLQFDEPDSVAYLVWVGISSAGSCDVESRLEDGHFDWSRMKFSTSAPTVFGNQPALVYMSFPLDIPLPVGKTIQSLRQLLQLFPVKAYSFDYRIYGAARCFATTSALDDDGHSIGPLSRTLSQHVRREHGKMADTGHRHRHHLKPGRWTIVLVHEAFDCDDQKHLDQQIAKSSDKVKVEGIPHTYKPQKRLRYMFAQGIPDAKPSGPRFRITDVPGYITHVLKGDASQIHELEQHWAKVRARYPAETIYYDEDDGLAILDRVYSNEGFAEEISR